MPDAGTVRVRTFYEEEVRRHGLTYKGLGFNRRESQLLRFEVLAAVGALHGKRVLDVGAGLGDFLAYLWARGIVPDYVGLDICDHLVAASRERFCHPGPGPARFFAGDILEFDAQAPFDYVVSSGIFGLDAPGYEARVAPAMARMFALCRRALAVNFLSARSRQKAPSRLYLCPSALLEGALDLTPTVTLRHDYLPNDFTLYLYRGQPHAVADDPKGDSHE